MSIIIPALLMALAGSMHCVAMCGGIALIVSGGPGVASEAANRRRPLLSPRFVVYGLGKTLTYSSLGLVVGLIGVVTDGLRGGQQVLSIIAGVVLVAVGLHLAGVNWLSRLVAPVGSSSLIGGMAARLRRDGLGTSFVIGVLNGLLPCGLVYGALAAALAQPSLTGSTLFMLVFGLATLPALWVSVRLAGWVSVRVRVGLTRVSGALLVLYGLFTALRGTTVVHYLMSWLG